MYLNRVRKDLLFLAFGALIFCETNCHSSAQTPNASAANPRTPRTLPTRPLPKGFESYSDPQSTGRLIYIKSGEGSASAKTAMRQFLSSLNGVFDAPPTITAATGDPKDTVVQAVLSTEIGGERIEGVAAVATSQGSSIAGLMYDRPTSLRTSYPRLSSYFSEEIGHPVETRRASAEPDLSTWTQRSGGDGSTHVLMPSDWQLASIREGGAVLNGPNQEQVVVGYQTYVAPGNPGYAPYMPPERALGWFLQKSGLQLLRVLQHDPATSGAAGQEELMMVEVAQPNGSRYKAVCRVITTPVGMNIWQFHLSSMAAPEDRFDASQPTMVAIWNNWKLDPAFVQEHLHHAAETAAQTRAMIMEGAQRSMHAFDNVNESIDQALRGVSTMENTNTGRRAETPIGSERAVIDACRRNGTNCREVPINELVQ